MLLYLDELLESKKVGSGLHNTNLPLNTQYNGHFSLQNRLSSIGSDGELDGVTVSSDADAEGITIGSDNGDISPTETSESIPQGYEQRNVLPVNTSYNEHLPTLSEDRCGEIRESSPAPNGEARRKYSKQSLIPRPVSRNTPTPVEKERKLSDNDIASVTSLDFDKKEAMRKESGGSCNSDSSGVYSSTNYASRHTSISSNDSYSMPPASTLKTTSNDTPTQPSSHCCVFEPTPRKASIRRSNSLKESPVTPKLSRKNGVDRRESPPSVKLPQKNGQGAKESPASKSSHTNVRKTKPDGNARDFVQDNKTSCKKGLSRSLSLRCRPVSKPVRLSRSNSQRVNKENKPKINKTETPASIASSIPVPVTSKSEPVPVTSKSEPVPVTSKSEPVPVTCKSEPVLVTCKSETVSVTSKSEPVLVTCNISEPVTSKSEPVTCKPVPITSKPVPITSKPVPITSKPVPIISKPVPITSKPVPITSKPEPISTIISKPITIKKITIKRSCSQKLKPGAKPASIVRSNSQRLKSPPEHVNILRREAANHVNKRDPISPRTCDIKSLSRKKATTVRREASLRREATAVKPHGKRQTSHVDQTTTSFDDSDDRIISSESSSYFSASDYNIDEDLEEEGKRDRLLKKKDVNYLLDNDFNPTSQSETYNTTNGLKPVHNSPNENISIIVSSSSTTNQNLPELSLTPSREPSPTSLADSHSVSKPSPTCTEASTPFQQTCKDYMLPYVDLYSEKSCQGYIGSLSITSDYRLPGIKAIKIYHQPQNEKGIELDIDSNGKNIIEGLMQSTIADIVDKSIGKRDASTSPKTEDKTVSENEKTSSEHEMAKEIDRLTKHNDDLMKELEEVYAAFEEEREKRVATDKVLQVLKVALEESEREVKKIPLMISYSEKRISLLEDILAEYKHEVYLNNSRSSKDEEHSKRSAGREEEEDSIIDYEML